MPTKDQIHAQELIDEIAAYTARLPTTIAMGVRKDLIYQTMTQVNEASAWETFNRRSDILFKEDKVCRVNGRLHFIRRGRYGMDAVVGYFKRAVDLPGILHDLMNIKLERVLEELKFLCDGVQVAAGPNEGTEQSSGDGVTGEASNGAEQTEGAKDGAEVPDPSGGVTAKHNNPASESDKPGPAAAHLDAAAAQAKRAARYPNLNNYLNKPDVILPGESSHDKTYKGGATGRAVSEETIPEYRLAKDGLEEVLSTSSDEEWGKRMNLEGKKRTREVLEVSSDSSSDSSDEEGAGDKEKKDEQARIAKKKKKAASKAKKRSRQQKKRRTSDVVDISDEDESDGESALRRVEEFEAGQRKSGVRGPENKSLVHWHPAVAMVDGSGNKRWMFKCKHCGAARTVKRTIIGKDFFDEKPRPKLTNLASHVTELHAVQKKAAEDGQDVASASKKPVASTNDGMVSLMEDFIREGALNPRKDPTRKGFLQLFVAWLVEADLPFTTGESPGIHRLFEYMQTHDMFALPSDTTVRNELAKIFILLHNALVKDLSAVSSKIAYSTDTWTNKQMIYTFAGTLAFYIDDDWCLQERLIDFHHLEDNEHAGIYAAKGFIRSAAARGGLKKISFIHSLTLDNCSVNDVIIRTLRPLLTQRYNIRLSPENSQIRCLAHIINLVVQKLLSLLDEAEDPDVEDYYESNKHLPAHYNAADDEELQNLESQKGIDGDASASGGDEEDELAEMEVDSGLSEIAKLRVICKKILASPQRRTMFRRHAALHYQKQDEDTPNGRVIAQLMPKRDVRHRWNWTHEMIERAVILRRAINGWIAEKCELSVPVLSASDWEFLKQLEPILHIFTEATSIMSQSKTATLPWVLPCFQMIHDRLGSVIKDDKVSDRLRDACAGGMEKLNHYFDIAKGCHSNTIATVLHPNLRSHWFSTLGPGERDKAETLFRYVFTQYEKDAPKPKDTPEPSTSSQRTSQMSFLERAANMSSQRIEVPRRNEVDRWLDFEGGHGDLNFPLVWWRAHAHEFPVISRMARDFLAIPGSSVSVERLFSGSRQVCVDTRSSLKASTVTELMCARQWIKQGLLKVDYSLARTGFKRSD